MQQKTLVKSHTCSWLIAGRHEPGTGEINYPFVLNYLISGYQGWVSCEYKPKTTTTEGLGWLHQYR